jgi:hypothetical protein
LAFAPECLILSGVLPCVILLRDFPLVGRELVEVDARHHSLLAVRAVATGGTLVTDIDCHFTEVGKYYVFNCYCDTKEQVSYLKKVCQKYGGKMSAYESAPLW